ncbi:hypothetical protein ABIA22_004711 [Sinorhizobium fredii]
MENWLGENDILPTDDVAFMSAAWSGWSIWGNERDV